ncbi:hypothetical protein LX36DRAFT_657409 [Colletotrichum falcatum]|nr:hypothetical protein LX36DRAFT_657409 [Colletotrichum falcatum]
MRISAIVSTFALALHLGGVAALAPRQKPASDNAKANVLVAKAYIQDAPVSPFFFSP